MLRSQIVYLHSSEGLTFLMVSHYGLLVCDRYVCPVPENSLLSCYTWYKNMKSFFGADLCDFFLFFLFTFNNKICQIKFSPCSEEI